MPEEKSFLSDEKKRVREVLEEKLLEVDYVDFVGVGFSTQDERGMIVTLGTTRPDLVQLLLMRVLNVVVPEVFDSIEQRGMWVPQFQIVKGRVRR